MRSRSAFCRLLVLAGAALTAAIPVRATTAVSNITGIENWWWNPGPLTSYESFTVGSQAATLQGFSFKMSWTSGSAGHVDIHNSSGSTFGSLIASTPTSTFATSGQGSLFIAAPPLSLQANSTYFIRFVLDSGEFNSCISSTVVETGLPGWSIGDSTWLVNYNQWSTGIPMFAVETGAVPEPSTAALALGTIGLGVALYRRRRIGAFRR